MEIPKRKNHRLCDYDYSTNGAYFITICTQNRRKIFWDDVGADIIRPEELPLSAIGRLAEQAIHQIPHRYTNVFVDKYVIMPDHVHLLLRIESEMDGRIISAPTISTVVGSMKRWIAKQAAEAIWQKSYYDHVIRNRKDYDEIWQYIENNPLKWMMKKQGTE